MLGDERRIEPSQVVVVQALHVLPDDPIVQAGTQGGDRLGVGSHVTTKLYGAGSAGRLDGLDFLQPPCVPLGTAERCRGERFDQFDGQRLAHDPRP